jgi:hypothetical protein
MRPINDAADLRYCDSEIMRATIESPLSLCQWGPDAGTVGTQDYPDNGGYGGVQQPTGNDPYGQQPTGN